jgi:hypothetical protein
MMDADKNIEYFKYTIDLHLVGKARDMRQRLASLAQKRAFRAATSTRSTSCRASVDPTPRCSARRCSGCRE